MIDIHTHIIPYVDDGSTDIATSIKMIKQAIDSGVTTIICTPHYIRGLYGKNKSIIIEKFSELKNAVAKLGLPINLYLGQEIKFNKDVKDKLTNGELLYLNNTNYILLEFSTKNKTDISDIIYNFQMNNINPIIAHIERYSYLTLDDIKEIKNHDGLIQVNASSIVGKEGHRAKKLVRKLIKLGLVDFVGSDMHFDRNYSLKEAYKFVSKKYGSDVSKRLFETNAYSLIEEQIEEAI